MKFCRFLHEDQVKYGAVRGDEIFAFPDLNELGEITRNLALTDAVSMSEIKFLPPATPSKIVCVGRNYSAHASEMGNEVPDAPMLFLKAPSALITEGEEIIIPPQSGQVEHEGELAVVIGKTCKNLTDDDDAFDFVFGYVCLNDVTARDLQKKDGQFARAKSFDTFCPVGAIIETDLDVTDIRVTTKVNGTVRQDGRTSEMVFPVDYLIRYISRQMTLNAGDIIATGTPAGVSKLEPGDVCEVEIEGIGVLTNKISAS